MDDHDRMIDAMLEETAKNIEAREAALRHCKTTSEIAFWLCEDRTFDEIHMAVKHAFELGQQSREPMGEK